MKNNGNKFWMSLLSFVLKITLGGCYVGHFIVPVMVILCFNVYSLQSTFTLGTLFELCV